ncbi:MAG: hypothetical protein IKE22_05260, partial [Atopobiaceae bacterium]|nr:hypothetical protein [Atopobiaceae bacterium]
ESNVNAGTATATITGIGNYQGTASKTFNIIRASISSATISSIAAQTYTGEGLTPTPTVKLGSTTLALNTDYTLSYENNVNAGTATVTVTGTGNFDGTKSTTFTISPKTLTAQNVEAIQDVLWNGSSIVEVTPVVKDGSKTLVSGTDYAIKSYLNNNCVGSASVTLEGKGNYTGSVTAPFTIYGDLSSAVIADIPTQAYTSSALEPQLRVTFAGTLLTAGTDYVATYSNNVEVGEATVALAGTGHYQGNASTTFQIVENVIDLSSATVTAADQTYTGLAQRPAVTVTLDGKQLVENVDYEVTYSGNVNVGTATVTVAGKGGYAGFATGTFTIAPASISSATVSTIAAQTYTGSAIEPKPTVKVGVTTLVEGVDYDLSYKNNVKVGTATVTVTGKGNYTGTATGTFAIAPADLSGATVSTIAAQTYTGETLEPKPTVKLGSNTLVLGTDYTLSYKYNVNVGTATVTVTGKGNYQGTATANFMIEPADLSGATISAIVAQTYTGKALTPRPTVKAGEATLAEGVDYELSYANNVSTGTATVTVTGKGNYTGMRTATFKIAAAPISKATVSAIAAQAYTGKAVAPRPTVKYGTTTLKLNTDYTLSYKNNVKAGTATVTVTGKGNYAGTKAVTFRIVAPSVSYRTHVQNVGWQAYVKDGAMSGTSGMAYRLEGINIKLSSKPVTGGITYRTHVQNIGWQGWRSDGAMSGTSGKALRLEAIQIKLTGEMAKKYDVYYRVHCQNIGWMGWARNGQSAGSAGYGYRLEGIQIVTVPKGAKAPAGTYKGIKANTTQAFRQK